MKREDKSARWRVLCPGAGHSAGNEGLKSEMLGKPGACPEPSGALWTCSTRAGKGSGRSRPGWERPGAALTTLEGAPETAKAPCRAPALPSQPPERWKQVIFQKQVVFQKQVIFQTQVIFQDAFNSWCWQTGCFFSELWRVIFVGVFLPLWKLVLCRL